ncbi:LysE family transporter [Rhizobiaceae bacterium BDR2-2]|uniref:LysE family transporter n=1 Tax=Ectorhizobium quercum TaxID=2965071 RepID=A0AAE3N167_9HYPH|nr:LysE family transporter [Ectorhizobium quercum]MCX8998011.1 LysE family transporter [Ectorhizobium quercum]
MMTASLTMAIFLLLLTPGPTNTLLAVGGASAGFRRSLPLILAENLGYMVTIVPLVAFAGPFLDGHPVAASALKLCSAVWVTLLALKLWVTPLGEAGETGLVTFRQVFVTTMLNPKALIFGIVLLPNGEFLQTLPRLVVFAGIVAVVAAFWLSAGASILRLASRRFPSLFCRVAAAFLMVFALSLAGSSFGLI